MTEVSVPSTPPAGESITITSPTPAAPTMPFEEAFNEWKEWRRTHRHDMILSDEPFRSAFLAGVEAQRRGG